MSLCRSNLLCVFLLLACLSGVVIAQEPKPDTSVTIHVVQRGETLFRIATRYNTTVDDLVRLNGITNPGSIQVGQRLLVPTHAAPDGMADGQIHIVQPGETLATIAALYNLDVEELNHRNMIPDSGAVYIGQTLHIPISDRPSAESSVQTADPAPQPAPQEISVSQATTILHTVQRGETLFRIAAYYGITVNELARANNIADPSLIYNGQQLVIPGYEAPQLAVDLPEPIDTVDVLPQILIEGQTVRIRIATSQPAMISGTFLERPLNFVREENDTRHTSLQGIPLLTEAGIYPLDLLINNITTGQQIAFVVNLQVASGRYGRETITLMAGRGDLLNPAIEEAELGLLQRVMTVLTEPRHFDGPMSLPAAATVISPFGTRRSFNGSAFDRFHSGTDFAGAPGTPILATAPGRVVLADTLHVRGVATVIDHGWGVFTGYWHQSEQFVQVGNFVSTGQVIGTIGSTGRVTGAHLHWELWAGGVPVDPMQWVRQPFN